MRSKNIWARLKIQMLPYAIDVMWKWFIAMLPPVSESTGCFGPKKKKDAGKGQKGKQDTSYQK